MSHHHDNRDGHGEAGRPGDGSRGRHGEADGVHPDDASEGGQGGPCGPAGSADLARDLRSDQASDQVSGQVSDLASGQASGRACDLPSSFASGPVSGLPSGFPSGLASDLASDLDEQALRRLLHGAVDDIEPSADALEQLRHAVPARRTRRRQAAVGIAAAVIFGAAAMPALIHVATTVGTAGERPANAASSRQRTHELSDGRRSGGGEEGKPGESTTGPDARKDEEKQKSEDGKKDGSTTGPTGAAGGTAPAPGPTLAASSPTCDRNQLGRGVGTVGTADKDGRVYGAFRVVNVSGTVCAVAGAGVVAAQAQGSAESSRVTVVDHTVGDAASGLPDPATEPSQVILQPGQAYEIKFAWVPSADGGPSGCSKPAGPTPVPSSKPSAAPGATTTAEEQPKATTQDTEPAKPPASVVLSHTPDVGEPKAADATIPDACAGTIYRTGALTAAPKP
ncbi:hypothetical protein AB0F13_19680 [Streptomyces sp. NPDC026206]|uniref:hypothetical protein n=1 Tax=Streptomyces sp. NPDC026206 TaxID=3157089 RepID=UPI0033ED2F6F